MLSNIAQSSANLVRGCSCSNSEQTLIPGNEARPINPFPLSFFASCFISRAAKTGLSLLRNQMETLAMQANNELFVGTNETVHYIGVSLRLLRKNP